MSQHAEVAGMEHPTMRVIAEQPGACAEQLAGRRHGEAGSGPT
ncbi:hypothetical protein [Streptomyces sp. NPDC086777]